MKPKLKADEPHAEGDRLPLGEWTTIISELGRGFAESPKRVQLKRLRVTQAYADIRCHNPT